MPLIKFVAAGIRFGRPLLREYAFFNSPVLDISDLANRPNQEYYAGVLQEAMFESRLKAERNAGKLLPTAFVIELFEFAERQPLFIYEVEIQNNWEKTLEESIPRAYAKLYEVSQSYLVNDGYPSDVRSKQLYGSDNQRHAKALINDT